MVKNIRNLASLAITALMMTCFAGKTYAFPLPTADIQRIGSSAKNIMEQIKQVKSDIDEVKRIIQLIKNGGYAEAAGALYNMNESGAFDRYGNMHKTVGKDLANMGQGTQNLFLSKEKQKKLNEKRAKKAAEKKAEREAKAKKETATLRAENEEKTKKNAFQKAYKFLKKNKKNIFTTIRAGSNLYENGSEIRSFGDAWRYGDNMIHDADSLYNAGSEMLGGSKKNNTTSSQQQISEQIPQTTGNK